MSDLHDDKVVQEAIMARKYPIKKLRGVIKQMENIPLTSMKGMSKMELISAVDEKTLKAIYLDAKGEKIDNLIPKKVQKKTYPHVRDREYSPVRAARHRRLSRSRRQCAAHNSRLRATQTVPAQHY